MSYDYVTVEFTWQDGDGNAAAGRYEWYPSASVTDTANNVGIDCPPQLGQLDDTGSMSVSLLANDNSGLSAFDWIFNKWIEGEESQPVAYQVNYADGDTQQLDSLTVVSS